MFDEFENLVSSTKKNKPSHLPPLELTSKSIKDPSGVNDLDEIDDLLGNMDRG